MKIKVVVEAIIDTEKMTPPSKHIVERAAFNKDQDNIACYWALKEVDLQLCERKIILELL